MKALKLILSLLALISWGIVFGTAPVDKAENNAPYIIQMPAYDMAVMTTDVVPSTADISSPQVEYLYMARPAIHNTAAVDIGYCAAAYEKVKPPLFNRYNQLVCLLPDKMRYKCDVSLPVIRMRTRRYTIRT